MPEFDLKQGGIKKEYRKMSRSMEKLYTVHKSSERYHSPNSKAELYRRGNTTDRSFMSKKYDPLVDSKQAIRKGANGVRKTPFAGVKSHYDVPFSKRGEQLRSHSVNKFLNPRSDKVEYHKQFSA